MTTIKEIAAQSGYSQATVSRLLNNDPNLSITANTKNKILEIANNLGYWENHQEKRIKPTIALLYQVNHHEQLQDDYFNSLKEKIISIVADNKIRMKIFENIDELITEADLFQGFLGVGSDEISLASLKKLAKVLPNGVFIDTNPLPNLFDTVKPNLALTVRDAVDKLQGAGYQKIGFIGAQGQKIDLVQNRDLREVIFRAIADSSEMESPICLGKAFSVDEGYRLGKKIAKDRLADAYLVASDTLSIGVLQAFNEENIRVPADVAIISINNSDVANYVSPPLTSYNINQDEMVQKAILLLTDHIMRPKRPSEEILINTNLVYRKSFVLK